MLRGLLNQAEQLRFTHEKFHPINILRMGVIAKDDETHPQLGRMQSLFQLRFKLFRRAGWQLT